jgi:hypothetical protein
VLYNWLKCKKFCDHLKQVNCQTTFCDVIRAMIAQGNDITDFQQFIDNNYGVLICEEQYSLSSSTTPSSLSSPLSIYGSLAPGKPNTFSSPHLLCYTIIGGRVDVALLLIAKGASVNSALDSAIRWCNMVRSPSLSSPALLRFSYNFLFLQAVVKTLVEELGADLNAILPSKSTFSSNSIFLVYLFIIIHVFICIYFIGSLFLFILFIYFIYLFIYFIYFIYLFLISGACRAMETAVEDWKNSFEMYDEYTKNKVCDISTSLFLSFPPSSSPILFLPSPLLFSFIMYYLSSSFHCNKKTMQELSNIFI